MEKEKVRALGWLLFMIGALPLFSIGMSIEFLFFLTVSLAGVLILFKSYS